jgi:hypothetical protein
MTKMRQWKRIIPLLIVGASVSGAGMSDTKTATFTVR